MSVVLPFVADLVSASLDVMSSPACARAATLLASLLDYDPSVDQLQPLLEAVVGAFDREIAATCVPVVKHYTAPSCALTAVASGGVAVPGVGKSFAVRQMVRVSLMVRNLAHFREYLAPQAVMRLAWRCLNGLCLAPAVRLLSSPDFQVSLCACCIAVPCIPYLVLSSPAECPCRASSGRVRHIDD